MLERNGGCYFALGTFHLHAAGYNRTKQFYTVCQCLSSDGYFLDLCMCGCGVC